MIDNATIIINDPFLSHILFQLNNLLHNSEYLQPSEYLQHKLVEPMCSPMGMIFHQALWSQRCVTYHAHIFVAHHLVILKKFCSSVVILQVDSSISTLENSAVNRIGFGSIS